MAPGTQVSPLIIPLENGHMKESVPAIEADVDSAETTDNLSQLHAGKPPRTTAGMRHCLSATRLANLAELEADVGACIIKSPSPSAEMSHFLPIFRSGSYSDQGPKSFMEDEYVCCDNLWQHIGLAGSLPLPGAFYGVFDGHNGKDAAIFTRKNLLKFITEDANFPSGMKKAVRNSYFKVDHSFADAASLDRSSGTTALIALIIGRAVLGKRGRAVELSKDHKPNCTSERTRIEKMGGVVYDGYLNGQLSVARALGDWHLKGPKGSSYPLSCEPELHEIVLTDEDEFLIIGCDGLWDVMSSQCAVTMVRKELTQHNDPERCSKELVKEALSRNSSDNLTVVVICFSSDPPSRIEIPRSQKRRSISAEGLDLLKGVLNGV